MITRRDFLKVTAAGGTLVSLGNVSEAGAKIREVIPDPGYCTESDREIPIIEETDVLVVGGSSGAVSAAISAAKSGSRVFLIAYMPYLGDDICGSFMYQLDKRKEQPQTALARKIFNFENDPRASYRTSSESELLYTQFRAPTPLHVKTVLEDGLIDHAIPFLYSSYVTNVLTDASGDVAGAVIANRSGRQAIRCKAIIDATTQASVAEMSGAAFTAFKAGKQRFEFAVVGNAPKEIPSGVSVDVMPFPFVSKGKEYPVTRYTFDYELKDKSYASFMEAEQFIRDHTWDSEQVDSADLLWYIPSWQIISEMNGADASRMGALRLPDSLEKEPFVHNVIKYTPDGNETVPSVHSLPKEAFTCKGVHNLFVLGPCAALSREVAAWLMRPVNAMTLGEIIGEYTSQQIKNKSHITLVQVKQPAIQASDMGTVGELLSPLRPHLNKGTVKSSKGILPVLGQYDVIVMGGGTAGAPAGISAAKQGVRTLVLEYLHGLGGLTTLGLIGRYWDGFREGYSAIIDQSVREMAPADHPRQLKSPADSRSDWKIEWYRRELRKNKADIWFGVMGCGALVNGNKVEGVVVATPFGRGVILAKAVIDSTGSADIAIAAGAPFEYSGKKTLAAQGAGYAPFELNDYYNNTDWAQIDDTDILDVSRIYVQGKAKYKGAYDVGKMPQTRERRRIIGDYIVSVYDVINQRRYADTISYHRSSFDTHGMTIDPYFTLNPPGKRHVIYDADVPLRALLPQQLEGILVTGLGASAHRDAMPVIRMQPCLQNQGYAVGYLTACAVREKKSFRKMDMKKIQKHLVEMGTLPKRVLTDREFKGYSEKDFKAAVETVTDQYKGLEVLLTDKPMCIRVVKKRIASEASVDKKVVYASILCILGDKEYVAILADKIASYPQWDEGWHYTASAQFGECMSRLDSLIIALGNAADPSTLPVILEKAALLKLEDHFSHYRAVTMACEAIGSNQASPVLEKLLTYEGMRYHDIPTYRMARNQVVAYVHDITYRNRILKELHVARALYYCGDPNKTGEEVMKRYVGGLEGHYSRYAREILSGT